MDVRALENLKNKIAGLVKSCEIVNSMVVSEEDWRKIRNIANLVAKSKGDWIDARQAEHMIFHMISDSLPESRPGLEVTGKLSSFVDEVVLTEHIFERFSGLPYQYDVYYELPNFHLPSGKELVVNNIMSLRVLSDEFVKGESLAARLGMRVDTETCYLRTRVAGYCDYDPSGGTIQQSLTLVKVLVERGMNAGALVDNYFVKYTSTKESAPIIHIHELSNDISRRVLGCSISKDVAEVLTRLQFASALKAEADPAVSFAHSMQDFLKLTGSNKLSLSRVIAACEWSFDAGSEHVPAMKVVKTCIGLESVYGEDSSEGGLTKSLSDRCAYSLAGNMEERKEIMNKCKELYKIRSSIVHGVKRKLSVSDRELLTFGMLVLTRSIDKEISLLPD